jgi:predicted Zn-dependent protease with MMP-like domain
MCPFRRAATEVTPSTYTRSVYEVDVDDLETMVREALDELPDEFRGRLDNLAIVVEERASVRDRDGIGEGGVLLGVYRGVPLTKRGSSYGMTVPDRIVVFQRPLERLARDEDHLYELVRHTVFHEVAHHFGISDARLRELGAY